MTVGGSPIPWIIGCGDVGKRIVGRCVAYGVRPAAVVRSEESAAACNSLGGEAVCHDLDEAGPAAGLNLDAARVIYLAPPPGEGVTDPRIRRFLDRHGDGIARLVLVSTTGVYGDQGGEWIDEDTPAQPTTDRGRRRLDAERTVIEWASRTGGGYAILRVPGIYAEDRLPLARLRRGMPVVREDQSGFTNRIHAEDLARICLAALDVDHAALVLNATDGHPTTMTDYFNRVADAVGLPRPPQVSLAEARNVFTPGMLSYALESRRIGNRRLLDTLNIALEYPDIDDTLARVRTANG